MTGCGPCGELQQPGCCSRGRRPGEAAAVFSRPMKKKQPIRSRGFVLCSVLFCPCKYVTILHRQEEREAPERRTPERAGEQAAGKRRREEQQGVGRKLRSHNRKFRSCGRRLRRKLPTERNPDYDQCTCGKDSEDQRPHRRGAGPDVKVYPGADSESGFCGMRRDPEGGGGGHLAVQ